MPQRSGGPYHAGAPESLIHAAGEVLGCALGRRHHQFLHLVRLLLRSRQNFSLLRVFGTAVSPTVFQAIDLIRGGSRPGLIAPVFRHLEHRPLKVVDLLRHSPAVLAPTELLFTSGQGRHWAQEDENQNSDSAYTHGLQISPSILLPLCIGQLLQEVKLSLCVGRRGD